MKVLAFENPWGQFMKLTEHMCSINNDVVVWRDNFMPVASAPTIADFEKIKTFVAPRHTANISNTATTAHKMNLIAMGEQAAFMFPYAVKAGVSYNDYFYYALAGQLWLWGGAAENGASCGLADSSSNHAWTSSSSSIGARLAYFGDVTEISGMDMLA